MLFVLLVVAGERGPRGGWTDEPGTDRGPTQSYLSDDCTTPTIAKTSITDTVGDTVTLGHTATWADCDSFVVDSCKGSGDTAWSVAKTTKDSIQVIIRGIGGEPRLIYSTWYACESSGAIVDTVHAIWDTIRIDSITNIAGTKIDTVYTGDTVDWWGWFANRSVDSVKWGDSLADTVFTSDTAIRNIVPVGLEVGWYHPVVEDSVSADTLDDSVYCAGAHLPTYTMTYDSAGSAATGGDVPTDASSPYDSGATVTVLGNTESLAKTGYTWAGWNTAADGSGTNRAAGSTFTIVENDTLFPTWKQDTLTVAISGGGTTEPAGDTAFADGDSAKCIALPGSDSLFVKWTVSGCTVSDSLNDTAWVKVTGSTGTVMANFRQVPKDSLSVGVSGYGSVTPSGLSIADSGTWRNIEATAGTDSEFVYWYCTSSISPPPWAGLCKVEFGDSLLASTTARPLCSKGGVIALFRIQAPTISYAVAAVVCTATVSHDTLTATLERSSGVRWIAAPPAGAGATLDASTGRIILVPTAAVAETLCTVQDSNSTGMDTASITITVKVAPPAFAWSVDTVSWYINRSDSTTPTSTGGAVDSFIPDTVYSWMSFDTATGKIKSSGSADTADTGYHPIEVTAYNESGTAAHTIVVRMRIRAANNMGLLAIIGFAGAGVGIYFFSRRRKS